MQLEDKETFLALPTQAIVELVYERGKPKVGVFVPNGNQRLVLSDTDLREGSDEFFAQVALTQTTLGLDNLKVFFGHGLPILFAPIFSASVLARGPDYYRLTAIKTLDIMLTSDEWVEFYNTFDVRVRVYGDLSVLAQEGCKGVMQSIEQVQQITRAHTAHMLFLGIGGEPLVGYDAAKAAVQFYQEHQREPSTEELIEFLYGQPVPPADFFIMSSKLAGLGALPALICSGDTQVYYLPVPGVTGLTERTYRAILYDLLSMRDETGSLGLDDRMRLRAWYADHAESVIGLGHRIGPVWVPDGL